MFESKISPLLHKLGLPELHHKVVVLDGHFYLSIVVVSELILEASSLEHLCEWFPYCLPALPAYYNQ